MKEQNMTYGTKDTFYNLHWRDLISINKDSVKRQYRKNIDQKTLDDAIMALCDEQGNDAWVFLDLKYDYSEKTKTERKDKHSRYAANLPGGVHQIDISEEMVHHVRISYGHYPVFHNVSLPKKRKAG